MNNVYKIRLYFAYTIGDVSAVVQAVQAFIKEANFNGDLEIRSCEYKRISGEDIGRCVILENITPTIVGTPLRPFIDEVKTVEQLLTKKLPDAVKLVVLEVEEKDKPTQHKWFHASE